MPTISTTIGHSVTIGTLGGYTYLSPLTIAATGGVSVTGTGDAVYSSLTNAALDNEGRVFARGSTAAGVDLMAGGSVANSGMISGAAGYGLLYSQIFSGQAGAGGAGITVSSGGSVTNAGGIEGGIGAPGATYASAGAGGAGVGLSGGGGIDNTGTITGGGGNGGFAAYRSGSGGGAGGGGITLSGGGSITNIGTIAGGPGGGGGYAFRDGGTGGSPGGVGITLSGGGGIANSGDVMGGNGGGGGGSYFGGDGGGNGGDGIGLSDGGGLANAGTIVGGQGGGGGGGISGGGGGQGGAGVSLSGAGSGSNNGSITGGTGGAGGGASANGGTGGVGGAGISLSGGGITNSGTVTGGQGGAAGGGYNGSDGGAGGTGINVSGGGVITNGGTIAGGQGVAGSAGLYGGVAGAAGNGIVLADGGAVVNGDAGDTTALIRGGTGIQAAGTSVATVTNFGTIAGTSGFGVDLTAGGTIFDAGTIIGGAGVAIAFGGTTSNLLGLAFGYELFGGVIGGAGARNTLELSGSVGAAVTVAYNGLGLTNFQQVLFGPGGYDALKLSNTSGAPPVTISGFAWTSDVIDLTAVGTDGGITNFDTVSDRLTIGGSLGTVALQLDATDATRFKTESDGAGGTNLLTVCFCRGTRILTESGERPVESLAAGELVLTASGEARPIVWIGAGRALVTRGRRNAATPVIVRKGALADNVPHRDLRVTKGHSLYIDDVLIPVEFLVNHRSILWDDHAQEVSVYHIELATHDIMLADGAPAESYRDDGNRWLFQNASSGWDFPPREPCAPVLTGGPVVDAVWRRLLERTGPRPDVPMTDDPDLYLLVDGQRVDGSHRAKDYRVFDLPWCASALRIASRAGSPAELGTARDPRLLGVAVRQVRLWQGSRLRMLDASDQSLAEGFHDFEPDNGFRWTDGDAALPATLFAGITGACQLELLVGGAMRYPLFAEGSCRVAA